MSTDDEACDPVAALPRDDISIYGKEDLIELFGKYAEDSSEKVFVVGLVGYPNVGKSSVINTMKDKMVCKAAPVPGETKIW